MQIDVFSLLAEARARIASISAAIEAARDFRLAEANLAAAVIGGTPASTGSQEPAPMASATTAPGHN
jgi:hypothetical protein